MSTSVLYDEPGPKTKRLSLIATVVASLIILAGIAWAILRLADRGQFDWELWAPILDPNDENFSKVWNLLGQGLLATVTAALLAIVLSLALGTLMGLGRMMLGRVLRVPLVIVMEFLRGLPVILTVFYTYTLVTTYGWDVSFLPGEPGLWFLVFGLTLYNSVIIAEILRAGVASLPRGQAEAGLAIGLTPARTMWMIQLPQAFRTMLPALISQLVVALKDTSLVAVLGIYTELLRRANLISLNLDNPIQMLFLVGVIFIVLNYGLSRLSTWLEARMARSHAPRDSDSTGDQPADGAPTPAAPNVP